MTKKRYTHIDLHYMGFNEVLELINELSVENEKLKCKVNGLKSELTIWKEDANEHIRETNKLFEENEQLKEEINYLKGQLKAYSEVSPEGKWILNKGDVE